MEVCMEFLNLEMEKQLRTGFQTPCTRKIGVGMHILVAMQLNGEARKSVQYATNWVHLDFHKLT
ncbi:uncharacterized protein PHALS_14795 [Plasmopara halstedii]|uniref:Uncharacterized protein n=1 Tax=Plasmopara halstedii TaxID=4781 RepID=A0A0P1ASZ9_PLAHL|nr:uncharacterized protein PHALS_14795 [Plasmopara halstedii]CEG45236.1 hypothetical protein PHALS_14795 [Plasmopara halstedii]|eukprot:XP_024581605.1 hypothetical protein PHALS_14795 [Plasmopara halstedii]